MNTEKELYIQEMEKILDNELDNSTWFIKPSLFHYAQDNGMEVTGFSDVTGYLLKTHNGIIVVYPDKKNLKNIEI